jgi:hypothetical protein
MGRNFSGKNNNMVNHFLPQSKPILMPAPRVARAVASDLAIAALRELGAQA